MATLTDDIYELLRETFVEDEFYVNDRTQPAFLISCTQLKPDKWQLLVNGVGLVGTYSSQKKTRERLKAIIENANIPVKVYRKSKHRKDKILFAENTVQRIELDKLMPETPFKVFNIQEWESSNSGKPMKPAVCVYKKTVPNCDAIDCKDCPHTTKGDV